MIYPFGPYRLHDQQMLPARELDHENYKNRSLFWWVRTRIVIKLWLFIFDIIRLLLLTPSNYIIFIVSMLIHELFSFRTVITYSTFVFKFFAFFRLPFSLFWEFPIADIIFFVSNEPFWKPKPFWGVSAF